MYSQRWAICAQPSQERVQLPYFLPRRLQGVPLFRGVPGKVRDQECRGAELLLPAVWLRGRMLDHCGGLPGEEGAAGLRERTVISIKNLIAYSNYDFQFSKVIYTKKKLLGSRQNILFLNNQQTYTNDFLIHCCR